MTLLIGLALHCLKNSYKGVAQITSFTQIRFHSQRIIVYCLQVCPSARVSRKWVGQESAWDEYQPEARNMPVKRGEPHLSAARIVRRHW